MSQGDFFSGLVQGLGSSISQMHQQKMERDYQDKTNRLNILMSASKDPNMLNSVRREVLRQGLNEFGPKYGALADVIVQDHDVATGRQLAGGVQEADLPDMPTTPASLQGLMGLVQQGQGPVVTDNMGAPPPSGTSKGGKNVRLPQMNPASSWEDPANHISAPAQPGAVQDPNQTVQGASSPFSGNLFNQGGSAPVTRSATGGTAANPSQAEIGVEQARKVMRATIGVMPSRPEALRSDSLSPNQEDQYRQMSQVRQQMGLQQAAQQSQAMWEMQNITIPMKNLEATLQDQSMTKQIAAHLASIPAQQQAQVLGQISAQLSAAKMAGVQLGPNEIKQMLGVNPFADPAANARAARVGLEQDLQSTDSTVKAAAMREVEKDDISKLDSKTLIAYRIAQIHDMQENKQVVAKDKAALVEGNQRAAAILKDTRRIQSRANDIYAGMDPVAKINGGQKTAFSQAMQEAKSMQESVAAQIAQSISVGKTPVTLGELLSQYRQQIKGRRGAKSFAQVLQAAYNDSNVVVIDDGTDVESTSTDQSPAQSLMPKLFGSQ
jgi:hypothetical protein